jgi:hypothetical protein
MTREHLNARPRELTQQELEWVTGGASRNVFLDSSGTATGKVTGSFDNNPGSFFGGDGALNLHKHIANG